MKYLPELPTDAKRDELIEAVMKERNYPCNPNAAARCGWEAAMDHIAAAPEVSAEPVGFIKSLAEIDEARAKGQSMVVWPKPYSDTKVALYTAPPDLQKEVDRLKGEVERLRAVLKDFIDYGYTEEIAVNVLKTTLSAAP